MKTSEQYDYDVIVVGGGISGLGAALKLKDAGLNVCVLEKENRVGGRVSTDHIDGFAIDRGATIFGGRFKHMKRLIKRLKLEQYAEDIPFAFELQDKTNCKRIRRARLDDVLFSSKLSFKAKLALLKFGAAVFFRGYKLAHGQSCSAYHLDDMSVEEYFTKIGGKEILDHFLLPGLNGPLGGNLRKNSRLILFQTFWNILLMRTWAIRGGMDRITEAMRKELNVRTGCEVAAVKVSTTLDLTAAIDTVSSRDGVVTSSEVEKSTIPCEFCHVECTNGESFTCKKAIIALPGNLVPKICDALPADIKKLLEETVYGKMVDAHVMLNRPTKTSCAAVGVPNEIGCGYEIELEHNRVSELCPEGKGMASVFMWDEKDQIITNKTDEEVKQRAEEIIRARFPECKNDIIGTHVVRWTQGIAHFAPGRLTAMCDLRKQMREWNLPIQLCGDYLDGIASESALATGEEAAENVMI